MSARDDARDFLHRHDHLSQLELDDLVHEYQRQQKIGRREAEEALKQARELFRRRMAETTAEMERLFALMLGER